MSTFMDNKEFMEYLERSGVMGVLREAFGRLFREPKDPTTALTMFRQALGGREEDSREIELLTMENTRLKAKYKEMEDRKSVLLAKISAHKATSATKVASSTAAEPESAALPPMRIGNGRQRGRRQMRGLTREEAERRREEERAVRLEEWKMIQKEVLRRTMVQATTLSLMLSYRACGILFGNIGGRQSPNWVFGLPAEPIASLVESKYCVVISKMGKSSRDYLTEVVISQKGSRQAGSDVFGAFREVVAELGDLVGDTGKFEHIKHSYGDL